MDEFIIKKGVLKEYNGPGGDVVIPDGVTHIGEKAFSGYKTLRSITIPESVTEIGNFAFQDCSGLRSVAIPNGVTEIGDGAFRYCSNLYTVILPNGISVLGCEAFCGCENLQGILLPESLKKIGNAAFQWCSTLKTIDIPNCTESIGNNAFEHCISLQNIEIPKGIKTIGDFTFDGCGNLQRISLPEGLTSIGNAAFLDCKKLKNVLIPETVTYIGDQAFLGCQGLADENKTVICGNILFDCFERKNKISIPEGIHRIGSSAFERRKNLRNLSIPNGVTEIGDWTFRYCSNLQSITLPNSVTTIGYCAFPEEMELHRCILAPDSQDEEQCKMLLNAIGIKNLIYPFLSDTLETNTFILKKLKNHVSSRKFIQEILPTLIEQNKPFLLAKLLSLVKKMPVDEIDTYIDEAENLPEIRIILMEYKNRIYPAELLAEMEQIQMEKNLGLREKTLADYRKEFKIYKDGDFYKITGYKGENESVWIPAQIKGIPVSVAKQAFADCEKLAYVYLENGVSGIDDRAFLNCVNLQEITIPESVSSIGKNVFTNCENLYTIHYGGSKTQWSSITKEDIRIKGFSTRTVICTDGEIFLSFS